MCDYRTVDPRDLVPADIIFPHYQDEAYEVLYNPDQRWFYKKGMEWDDVVLFKLGDNATNEEPCKFILGFVMCSSAADEWSVSTFCFYGSLGSERYT